MIDKTVDTVSQEDLTAHTLITWLALWRAPTLGSRAFSRLEMITDSLDDIFDPAFYRDPLHRIPEALQTYLQQPDWAQAERDFAWTQQANQHILTWHHADYPSLLKEIYSAPPLLFIRGDLNSLKPPPFGMVGSRNPTPHGQQIAYDFAKALGYHGWSIVSGLALGIDAASHQGALAANTATLAVLGTGIDVVYPQRHRQLAEQICQQGGALISEFPLGVKPQAKHFPRRNRIISGLSRGVLVVEAALKSGSLITAHYALEQNRDVFAIPGSIHNPLSKGCHGLIRQGAILVETIEDILVNFNETAVQPSRQDVVPCTPDDVSGEEAKVLSCLGWEPCHMDELVTRSEWDTSRLSSLLLELELKGHVKTHAQGYVRVKKA